MGAGKTTVGKDTFKTFKPAFVRYLCDVDEI